MESKSLGNSLRAKKKSVRVSTIKQFRKVVERIGFNISLKADYYSPLPSELNLQRNVDRWNKPSSLVGVNYDIDQYKSLLSKFLADHWEEYNSVPSYSMNQTKGFGPGYTEVDAFILYCFIRDIEPNLYLEVGSGLSTYYANLAARQCSTGPRIKCIEPYPYDNLFTIPNVEVVKDEVQNVPIEHFKELKADDILFIDSSHVVKLDGDVPYLFLEVLPALNEGVIIHIHDIPFPYNIPYPADYRVLGKGENSALWPRYWTEAMLLQAFLAFNDSYEILMSMPLLRFFDESYLVNNLPIYQSMDKQPNTFSSIWLRKVK